METHTSFFYTAQCGFLYVLTRWIQVQAQKCQFPCGFWVLDFWVKLRFKFSGRFNTTKISLKSVFTILGCCISDFILYLTQKKHVSGFNFFFMSSCCQILHFERYRGIFLTLWWQIQIPREIFQTKITFSHQF